jgi:hypothetical protein
MENEGVAGTIERRLQKVKRVSCREAVSSIHLHILIYAKNQAGIPKGVYHNI